MNAVALVGLVDARGWLLLQERDDNTTVDPDRWSLVGGAVEPRETPSEAAHRELAEETEIDTVTLTHLGAFQVACRHHGQDDVELFTGRTTLSDADVVCHDGRQIVFVRPDDVPGLDLTDTTRALYPRVLGS